MAGVQKTIVKGWINFSSQPDSGDAREFRQSNWLR
jgi:hypothetical protein